MIIRAKYLSVLLILAISWSPAITFAAPQYSSEAAPTFSAGELDEMLAPIALYPDPLLAQILPAATFVTEVEQAQQLLNGHVDEGLIDRQGWDVSVKAIAHYPEILSMMAENPDWTAALGQAYITQESAVAGSIQHLRAQALHAGVLRSSPQLHVIVESNFIRIVPAQPRVMYVPQYSPEAIWGFPDIISTPAPASGLIGFGTGLMIGSWLNRDWDWSGRGPYYHGWTGGGWVGSSRNYVNITHNNTYVNNRFTNINVNRDVTQRNTRDFRARAEREANARKPGAVAEPPAHEGKAPSNPAVAPGREKPAPAPGTPPAAEKEPPAARAPRGARGRPTPTPSAPPAAEKAPPAPAAPSAPRAKPAPAPSARPEVKAPAAPAAPPAPRVPRARPAPTPSAPPAVKAPPAPAAPSAPRAKPAPAPSARPEVKAPAAPRASRARPARAPSAPPAAKARPAPAAPAAPRAKPAPAAKPSPAPKPAPTPPPQKPEKGGDH